MHPQFSGVCLNSILFETSYSVSCISFLYKPQQDLNKIHIMSSLTYYYYQSLLADLLAAGVL